MTKTLMLLATLFSMNAFAHVEPGEYTGVDQDGEKCTFIAGEMWFENNMQHPLTERLPLTNISFKGKFVSELTWNLGHPPVVNTESGLNRYNHDLFQQIIPNATGASSVTLIKGDDEAEGKPIGIIYIEDNYRKKDESRKLTCLL